MSNPYLYRGPGTLSKLQNTTSGAYNKFCKKDNFSLFWILYLLPKRRKNHCDQ